MSSGVIQKKALEIWRTGRENNLQMDGKECINDDDIEILQILINYDVQLSN